MLYSTILKQFNKINYGSICKSFIMLKNRDFQRSLCNYPVQLSIELLRDLTDRTQFTETDIVSLQKQFNELAGNKDYLTKNDFNSAVRFIGAIDSNLISQYFLAFDRNHNGQIDFTEFVLGMAGMRRVLTEEISVAHHIRREGRDVLLSWEKPPQTVLLIKKWKDRKVTQGASEISHWLSDEMGIKVFVEPTTTEIEFEKFDRINLQNPLKPIDFIVCVGGDGTLLHAASLFCNDEVIPPTMIFSMGSLGFLSPFSFNDYKNCLTKVLNAYRIPVYISLRTRIRGDIYTPNGSFSMTRFALNECLVDRGISPVLSRIECYVDDKHVTTVQADGLIVATPSGSTAYNLSAGGCMVAPSVPCLLLTPIAPHSLSFRPIVLPVSSKIRLEVPMDARATARASFDSRQDCQIHKGSSIILSAATFPLPIINMHRLEYDWFQSIRDKLNWNERILQKSFENDPREGHAI